MNVNEEIKMEDEEVSKLEVMWTLFWNKTKQNNSMQRAGQCKAEGLE
jgi:hypothetical protein